VYASYSTGFRSGGFSGRGDPLNRTSEIEPEELTSYEVGLKSVWLDGRLVVNGSLFYNVARDVQLGLLSVDSLLGTTTLLRRNASKEVIRGGDFDIAWLALPGLRLGVDVGVLRSKYAEFDDDVPDPSLEDEDPAISPNYTMAFSAQYEVPIRYGRLGLRAYWTHTGAYNSDADGTDALRVGKFGLLDARVSLALLDERTELALFGTNLLDRRYFASGQSFGPSFGYVSRFYAPPRMYGLELRRSF
jgi:iron complex outermembrane recepter protein